MIEVEKKFVITGEAEKNVVEKTLFVDEEVFTDVYYDTADYKLLRNDIWFRSRDGKFELKVFIPVPVDETIDRYDEIDDEQKIKEKLGISPPGNLNEIITAAGYRSFCVCKTTRRKYKKDGFNIVLDAAEFGDGFSYKIGEVELMVNGENGIKEASQKVADFAKLFGLSVAPPNGKIVEYLKAREPAGYQTFLQMQKMRQVVKNK